MHLPSEIWQFKIATWLSIFELYHLSVDLRYQKLFQLRFEQASFDDKIKLAIAHDDVVLVDPILEHDLDNDPHSTIYNVAVLFHRALDSDCITILVTLFASSKLSWWSPLEDVIGIGLHEHIPTIIKINPDRVLDDVAAYLQEYVIDIRPLEAMAQALVDLGLEHKLLDRLQDKEPYLELLCRFSKCNVAIEADTDDE